METKQFDQQVTNEYDLSQIEPQFRDEISAILTDWGVTEFNVRMNLVGKSSTFVFLVDINCGDHDGQAVLKISRSSLNKDINGMTAARRHAPRIEKSLPELIKRKKTKNLHAILLTVVGEGFLQAAPLSDVPVPILNGAFQKTSMLLLEDWNSTARFSNDYYYPSKILKKFLGHRIESSGRIWDFIRDTLEIGPNVKTINVLLNNFPNPLILLEKEYSTDLTKQQIMEGLVHGDFHSNNILIRYERAVRDIFVIDFDLVNTKSPLFFDHSYLELSYLLNSRGYQSYEKWLELCEQLVYVNISKDANEATTESDDMGLLWSVGMLRESIVRWKKSNHKGRIDDITKQLLLSRVSAGLNFASKRVLSHDSVQSNKEKTLAFIYAASAAKQYFDFCGIPMSPQQEQIALPGKAIAPSTNDWRGIWKVFDNFTPRNGKYVLLASDDLRTLADSQIATLAKLPWSLVIDLSARSDSKELSELMAPELRRIGTFSQLFPAQYLNENPDVDCLWLQTEEEYAVEKTVTISDWRRRVLPAVRTAFRELYQNATLLPIYLLVMGKNANAVKLRALHGAAEEESGGLLSTVVVADGQDDSTKTVLEEESENLQSFHCNWSDFSLSIKLMLGDLALGRSGTSIPVYDTKKGEVRQEILEPELAARYLTSVQLVGSPSGDQRPANHDVGNFYKGNTIAWHELNLKNDLMREGYEGPEGWLSQVRNLLRNNPARSFKIAHSVGAGGTTVARRLAWDLKSEYPVVVLNSYNSHTVNDIVYLFHRSRLPVLIVVEANSISATKRDSLFQILKNQGARFLILDVSRDLKPKNSTVSIAVPDPMTEKEANRFKSTFQKFTDGERSAALEQLCNPAYVKYRLPFFFGLIAFGEEYVKIGDFISSVIDGTPAASLRWIAMISLITRYSQKQLPYTIFQKLSGLNNTNAATPPTESLGECAKKALIYDGEGIGIVHPVLADEFLKSYLSPGLSPEKKSNQVISGYTDFCVWFIDALSETTIKDITVVHAILTDLFVDRGFWLDSVASNPFSPLISSLPTKEGQRRVLETLSQKFPNNAHFFNHLGRHINLKQSGTFDEAISAVSKAIELESNNSLHWHSKGMVYRSETERVLAEWLHPDESIEDRLKLVRPLVSSAIDAFSHAVDLADSSTYPLVSPLQMVFRSLERIMRLGNFPNYGDLLTSKTQTGEWCRGLLNEATILLENLHKFEAGSPHSLYRKICDADYQKVFGNYKAMISGLHELLLRPEVNKLAIRRMLVRGHLEQHSEVSSKAHNAIAELMLDNLREAPAKDYDMRTWFRSARKLPNFSVSNSIEKFTEWSLVSDSDETHYYLYILHFLQSKLGIRSSAREAAQYLSLLRNKTKTLDTKKSYEWLGHSKVTGGLTLVHHSELGEWDSVNGFFQEVGKLERVKGRISKLNSPQAGAIKIEGLEAFFVPKLDFIKPHDLNASIVCYVGFSFEGPRAWMVRRPVERNDIPSGIPANV